MPFEGCTADEIERKVKNGRRPDMDDFRSPIADELCELLQKCWHQDKEQRPDMSAVVNTLQTFLSDQKIQDTVNDETAKLQRKLADDKLNTSTFLKYVDIASNTSKIIIF